MTKFVTLMRIYKMAKAKATDPLKTTPITVNVDAVETFRANNRLGKAHRATVVTKSGAVIDVTNKYSELAITFGASIPKARKAVNRKVAV